MRSATATALVALVLALGGCGGGDSSTVASNTAGSTTTGSAPVTTIKTPTTTTAAPHDVGNDDGVAFGSISLEQLHRCAGFPIVEHFRCGTLAVPWERADHVLGKTKLNFAVRRHRGPNGAGKRPAKGTIFAVEGGPGYPSSHTAGSYVPLFGKLLRTHDLVLVDQRGTGNSGPIPCGDVNRGNAPEMLSLANCAAKLGPIAQSYRTSASADDIDSVRRALGLRKIALYGDSYGTYLGQSYAYRHPNTLNAVVLDSAYPAYGEDPWYPTLPQDGIRNLTKVCERTPSCHGDAGEKLARTVRQLRHSKHGVNPLLEAIGDAAYGPPATYRRINRAIAYRLRGVGRPYQQLTREGRAGYRRPKLYSHAGELVIGCNDYPMIWKREASEPERRAQLQAAIRAYPKDAFRPFTVRETATAPAFSYLECLTWPKPNRLYEPAVDPGSQAPTRAPVLVVSGELDDTTTPQEGRWVARRFPNGRWFEYPNRGHVDALYNSKRPAARRIQRFLENVIG